MEKGEPRLPAISFIGKFQLVPLDPEPFFRNGDGSRVQTETLRREVWAAFFDLDAKYRKLAMEQSMRAYDETLWWDLMTRPLDIREWDLTFHDEQTSFSIDRFPLGINPHLCVYKCRWVTSTIIHLFRLLIWESSCLYERDIAIMLRQTVVSVLFPRLFGRSCLPPAEEGKMTWLRVRQDRDYALQ